MKLRNKKTGVIGNLVLNVNTNRESYTVLSTENGDTVCGNLVLADYDTLEGLSAEWEDYEEPKEYWTISGAGYLWTTEHMSPQTIDDLRQIGNLFETKEEAEKAVEKLKCFTNLKNHEFMFDGWYYGTDGNIVILANAHEFNDMEEQDLTKVFGEKIC